MSDAEIRDELLTLLVAGHETTATALSWAVERLVRHPEKLERLRAEVRGRRGRLPDGDDPGDAAAAAGDLLVASRADRAGRDRRLRAARRRHGDALRSTSSTATPRSTPSRSASCPSASSTTRPAPTPGSPSAAACAAASAPPSPSSRWPSSSRELVRHRDPPGPPRVRARLPPRDHRDPAPRRRGHPRLSRGDFVVHSANKSPRHPGDFSGVLNFGYNVPSMHRLAIAFLAFAAVALSLAVSAASAAQCRWSTTGCSATRTPAPPRARPGPTTGPAGPAPRTRGQSCSSMGRSRTCRSTGTRCHRC